MMIYIKLFKGTVENSRLRWCKETKRTILSCRENFTFIFTFLLYVQYVCLLPGVLILLTYLILLHSILFTNDNCTNIITVLNFHFNSGFGKQNTEDYTANSGTPWYKSHVPSLKK